MSIVKLFKKVSDREQEKDQEILINLIEKSKESKQKVENYVTKKPSSKKPRKLKHVKTKKNSAEVHKIRHKRKKLIDTLKKRRKPSHMQVLQEVPNKFTAVSTNFSNFCAFRLKFQQLLIYISTLKFNSFSVVLGEKT